MKLLTERQVQDMIGISMSTLRKWRAKRVGPEFVKFGFTVRYPESALKEYIRRMTITNKDKEKEDELKDRIAKEKKMAEEAKLEDEFDFYA